MRKKEYRTRFRVTMDIIGYILAVIVAFGLIAMIRHVVLYHY